MPNATPAPEVNEPESPEETSFTIAYSDCIGMRGNSANTCVAVQDSQSPERIIMQTNGDLFLDAQNQMQVSCRAYTHTAMGVVTQFFYEDVGKAVIGSEHHVINGNHTLHINANQEYNVVLDRILNIGLTEHKIVGSDQTVEVGGKQKLDVQGDQEITIVGNRKDKVQGDGNLSWLGKLANSVLGDFDCVKVSSESGVTISDKNIIAIGEEASLNIGASEKVNIGAQVEQTYARKHGLSAGTHTEIKVGPRKEVDHTTSKHASMLSEKVGDIAKNKFKMNKTDAKVLMKCVKALFIK